MKLIPTRISPRFTAGVPGIRLYDTGRIALRNIDALELPEGVTWTECRVHIGIEDDSVYLMLCTQASEHYSTGVVVRKTKGYDYYISHIDAVRQVYELLEVDVKHVAFRVSRSMTNDSSLADMAFYVHTGELQARKREEALRKSVQPGARYQ